MALAWNVEKACPQCGDESSIYVFEKEEGTITKECYSCAECGAEWSELKE